MKTSRFKSNVLLDLAVVFQQRLCFHRYTANQSVFLPPRKTQKPHNQRSTHTKFILGLREIVICAPVSSFVLFQGVFASRLPPQHSCLRFSTSWEKYQEVIRLSAHLPQEPSRRNLLWLTGQPQDQQTERRVKLKDLN